MKSIPYKLIPYEPYFGFMYPVNKTNTYYNHTYNKPNTLKVHNTITYISSLFFHSTNLNKNHNSHTIAKAYVLINPTIINNSENTLYISTTSNINILLSYFETHPSQ